MISNSLLIPSFNVLSDGAGWSFDDDKKFVDQALNHNPYHSNNSLNLSYYIDRYQYFNKRKFSFSTPFGLDYFHGLPSEKNQYLEFFQKLRSDTTLRWIRVTHENMALNMIDFGINSEIVKLLPLPIDSSLFIPATDLLEKKQLRDYLGIPSNLFLIGSFQKDGVGWGDGFTPKLEKGPDIFIDTIRETLSLNA